jgi:hypothetical protein
MLSAGSACDNFLAIVPSPFPSSSPRFRPRLACVTCRHLRSCFGSAFQPCCFCNSFSNRLSRLLLTNMCCHNGSHVIGGWRPSFPTFAISCSILWVFPIRFLLRTQNRPYFRRYYMACRRVTAIRKVVSIWNLCPQQDNPDFFKVIQLLLGICDRQNLMLKSVWSVFANRSADEGFVTRGSRRLSTAQMKVPTSSYTHSRLPDVRFLVRHARMHVNFPEKWASL